MARFVFYKSFHIPFYCKHPPASANQQRRGDIAVVVSDFLLYIGCYLVQGIAKMKCMLMLVLNQNVN